MERMTEWDETNNCWCVYCNADSFDKITGPISRLAAYEDLGLTPDEIWAQLSTYSSLLCELTNNRLSKTNYALEDLLPIIHDKQAEECESCNAGMEDSMRKRLRHVLQSIYVVVVVDLAHTLSPTVYLFDNSAAADKYQRAISNATNIVSITKESVLSTYS